MTGYFTASYVSSLDDSEQPFAVWVPRTYSRRRSYPLIVALHGTDADHRMIPEDCFRMHERGFREDVILLSPFGRGDTRFLGPGEADLWEAMNWVKARYRIDGRRQYLTGLSMGGFATWRLGCEYPEQWAALAPVCGGGSVAALPALAGIPVWCVHGDQDDCVPVEHSRRLVAELRRRDQPCRFDELKGWGHDSWNWLYNPARRDGGLVRWFLAFRKKQAAPPVIQPKRHGRFLDLFSERLVISYPGRTGIPHETALLRAEADFWSRFSFGDYVMRSGQLIVKADTELTLRELQSANQLMLGRTDNHVWLKRVQRRLLARHRQGRLWVGGESWIGKTLVAATVQASPWNTDKLLGVITYQAFRQMRGMGQHLGSDPAAARWTSVYDTAQHRFVRRIDAAPPSA